MDNRFDEIFRAIRPLYAAHAGACLVTADAPGRYWLDTHEVRARDGYRTGFGGVEMRKSYVAAHLMPVYVHPELLETIGDDLRRRMQGKSCFNFRRPDAALFAELGRLIDAGAARFAAEGRIGGPPA